jgi:RNA polymerase sigma factor (sigma-70 family)
MGVLGEREQELIALRYGADLTARQIGEIVGAETNAVEVALHRALGRLRTALEAADSNASAAAKAV